MKVDGNLAVSDKNDNQTQQQTSTSGKGSLESVMKALVKKGKEQGFLTYDELNKALPAEEFSSEQIEDAMAPFSDIGVQLVEKEDDVNEEAKDGGDYQAGGNIAADDTGRTDDPVRMYLREMGAVELLSREGEIAIAKRIEAGREMMIGGICESPLAIESIIAWYKALQEGDILLREVIDLDATYTGGPEAMEDKTAMTEEELEAAEAKEAEEKEAAENAENEGGEDDEANMSLSAM